MRENDCTLLLSTYDGGEDLWEGFFKALTVQWPDFDLPIVMNTETKSFSYPGLHIRAVNCPDPRKDAAWGKRLIHTLQEIDTEYVLFFLEDFWFDAPVDTAFFERCRQWMRDNADVTCLSFQPTHGANIRDGRFERFEKRPRKGGYRMNCQAALWRREELIRCIRPHENPWEWEMYGTIRSFRYDLALYSLMREEPRVFSYDMGGVLYKGRWHERTVRPLIEKYNLEIDLSIRGTHEEWMSRGEKRKRNLIRGIKNRINIVRSLI